MTASAPRFANLRDHRIDTCGDELRGLFLARALQKQVEFATTHVEFWQKRLAAAEIDASLIRSTHDYARIPILSKEELRAASPWDLIPAHSRPQIRICRSTSGTSGTPTPSFWTHWDWLALVDSVTRMIESQQPDIDVVAYNGYQQGHLAGPVYDAAIQQLGGISIARHYVDESRWSTLAQLSHFGCNALVLAEGPSLRKSGLAVRELLDIEPDFFSRSEIRWWIGSSTTFSEEIRHLASEQGVLSVTNLCGSSEFGLFAVSCPQNPQEFHLGLGHVFVEVVDENGNAVGHGDCGRIVVTHLHASSPDGALVPHQGTQILRLDIGDKATVYTGRCSCGRTTPRISNIRRGA